MTPPNNGHDGKPGKGGNKGGGKNKDGKGGGKAPTLRSLIRSLMGGPAGAVDPEAIAQAQKAAADLRYDPMQKVLQGQVRASKQQTKRDQQYYKQYLNQVKNLQQGTADVYAGANQQLAQAQAQATGGDALLTAIIGQQRGQNAQMLGGSAQGAINPLAQAQSVRATNALNNQARVIGQGAAQGAYMIDQKRIGRRGKLEQRFTDQARTTDAKNKIVDLLREKGDYISSLYRDDQDAMRAFLLDLMNTRQAQKDANRSYKLDKKAANSSSSSSSGDNGGEGDARDQRQDNKKMRQDARALLKSYTGKPDKAKAFKYLVKNGIDPRIARTVLDAWIKAHDDGDYPQSPW